MLKVITDHINNRFGSRRGLLSSVRFELIGKVGGFSRYRRIDWSRVERLVFVCAGNICRSPLAEAVARDCGVPTASAGIACDGGHPADARAVELGSAWGLDLKRHRSMPIQRIRLSAGDLVVGMEPHHLISPVFGGDGAIQMTLLGLWGEPGKVYIHDPFNTGARYFEYCEHYVVDATKLMIKSWLRARDVLADPDPGMPSP